MAAPGSDKAVGGGGGGLLSLGAPRGRRAQPPSATGDDGRPASQRADPAVRATDNDAMGSRLSAVLQGYIPSDQYTRLLASNEASNSATLSRRSPIINIGTYLRCMAVDRIVGRFLSLDDGPKQILSLGAGSDSRFWRIQSQPQLADKLLHYVELDFPQLTAAKVDRIVRHEPLSRLVGKSGEQIVYDGNSLQTSVYSILPCDIRTLAQHDTARAALLRHLDPDVDTLIIAECVLAYLSPESSERLLETLGRLLTRSSAVCYEMCVAGEGTGPPSRFGSVMLTNLQSRNLSMPGSRTYATLDSHARRFERTLNVDGRHSNAKGQALTLKSVWHDQTAEDRAKLSRIEGLDEVEELDMLLAHYAVSWYTYDAERQHEFLTAGL